MNVLPDTHVLLWWMDGDPRLPRSVAETLIDVDNSVFISAVSILEMATKVSIKKLKLPAPVLQVYEELRARLRASPMPVTVEHAARVSELALHHRDPFDRLLIAQAEIEGLTLLTADSQLRAYGVSVFS